MFKIWIHNLKSIVVQNIKFTFFSQQFSRCVQFLKVNPLASTSVQSNITMQFPLVQGSETQIARYKPGE